MRQRAPGIFARTYRHIARCRVIANQPDIGYAIAVADCHLVVRNGDRRAFGYRLGIGDGGIFVNRPPVTTADY